MTSLVPSRHLIAIVGPTAVGKSGLAVRLAEHIPAEIVSADSRQVYRYMNIGTAKPSEQDRKGVRHHLLDIVDPDDTLTLSQYQALAYAAIDGIQARGAVPLLVGGTGLYVRAVLEGLRIPRVEPNPALRDALYAEADAEGAERLHQRLAEMDRVAAERIDPRNVRRVVRALEVCCQLGTPISSLQESAAPPYRILRIGLNTTRALLYQRIDRRVEQMLANGLVEEVRSLVARGYGGELPAMSALGYKQIGLYLRGKISYEDTVALIKRQTRRLVRQQANWFRNDDPLISWFDASAPVVDAVLPFVQRFLDDSAGLGAP